jgi:hypothetical protein
MRTPYQEYAHSIDNLLGDKRSILLVADFEQFLEDVFVVLAHQRRPPELSGPLAVNEPRKAERAAHAAGKTLHLAEERACGQMLVGQHIRHGEGRRGGDAERLKLCRDR